VADEAARLFDLILRSSDLAAMPTFSSRQFPRRSAPVSGIRKPGCHQPVNASVGRSISFNGYRRAVAVVVVIVIAVRRVDPVALQIIDGKPYAVRFGSPKSHNLLLMIPPLSLEVSVKEAVRPVVV
jgi:hypothetical protein